MQQQPLTMGQAEEEEEEEERFAETEEKGIVLPDLREIRKRMASKNLNMRSMSDASAAVKTWEAKTELNHLKQSLAEANKELKIRERAIELLKTEAGQGKQLETKLAEKDALVETMKEDVEELRCSVEELKEQLEEKDKQIEELESEVVRRIESEKEVLDSFVAQTTKLEHATMLIEKSKHETASLRRMSQDWEECQRLKEEVKRLEKEVQSKRDNRADEAREFADEIRTLRRQLQHALEGEEQSKRAMDDMALALREVAAEASQAKEKLHYAEEQLGMLREEAKKLKSMFKSKEVSYELRLSEAKKENETLINTVNRLRLEAEESVLAWNVKEIEFVKCIKKAEDDKEFALQEKAWMLASLRFAEEKRDRAKEETSKLRDIMKQALNEANVTKEAAAIARSENSQLKDAIQERDRALVALMAQGKKSDDKDQKGKHKRESSFSSFSGDKMGGKSSGTFCAFPLPLSSSTITATTTNNNKHNNYNYNIRDFDDDLETDDDLTDSIFDLVEPQLFQSAAQSPARSFNHQTASDDERSFGCYEDLEPVEQAAAVAAEDKPAPQFEDVEMDKGGNQNKKRMQLLKKFGDLWRRKNPNQNQTTTANCNQNQTQNQNLQQKEVSA